jgi:hypothetical protein
LAEEFDCLRQCGFSPRGGRLHWLRFTLRRLIPALERAGALYDTSLGWGSHIGFRAGACFAFPPYNFQWERPATFLEIPLAIMDLGLYRELAAGNIDYVAEAQQLLSVSRQYGWGGISLLWHPTAFGGGWLAPQVGNALWQLIDHREEWNDTWVSADSFVQSVRDRYVKAGLLPAEHSKLLADNEDARQMAFARAGADGALRDGVDPGNEPQDHGEELVQLVPGDDDPSSLQYLPCSTGQWSRPGPRRG